MSEASKAARSAMKEKISRLTRVDPSQRVDASDYTTPGLLNAGVKTGARPVRGRRFKKGGKVEGDKAPAHAGRKPRKSGGRAYATPDNLLNRDMVEANDERSGTKHVGAFKKGGRAKKAYGGGMNPMQAAQLLQAIRARRGPSMNRRVAPGAMAAGVMPPPSGMPMARKSGGRTMHPDEAEDKKLIKKVVKKDAIKPGMKHGGSCKCAMCMGGKAYKANGGVADQMFMNPATGSVDSYDGWDYEDHKTGAKVNAVDKGEVVPVKWHNGAWVEPKKILSERAKHKAGGGSLDGEFQGTRPTGGRLARKHGGAAKGKMNVNIIIGAHRHPADAGAMAGPMGAGPRVAGIPAPTPGVPLGALGGLPPGGAPMGGGVPPMPPAAMGAAPPMMRRSGGRVKYPIKDGAGGGLGRLEKIKSYGGNAYPKG